MIWQLSLPSQEIWRTSKFGPRKDSQCLCLISWDCPCCLGIPRINQLETATNHSNCSACLPDLEIRDTITFLFSPSWPKWKQSSLVPNARLRTSDHPQIEEANCLDKVVDNFLVLSCQMTLYFFSQIFVDVHVGAKSITRMHRCHWGSRSPGLKWLPGDRDSSWDTEPWTEEQYLSSLRCFTTRGERHNCSQTLNS